MRDSDTFILDGHALTPETLLAAAQGSPTFSITDTARQRMIAARGLVDKAVTDSIPVYGVTTGLGARATETLDAATLSDFSYQTIRGRAHAVGDPTAPDIARAALIVRANTLTLGAAAASPAICDHILACLNARITPVVGNIASIGAADLVWNATAALALIGEGPMQDPSGTIAPGADLMRAAEITPPSLGPRDGLALCNSSSYSAALAAFGYAAAAQALNAAQAAAALSMEGFAANLSPLDPRALALRRQPGQREAANGLLRHLEGSALTRPGAARRLQDPISIRNIAQIHGATFAALAFLRDAILPDLNGASDNPAALIDDATIISTGNYFTPHLTNALETVSRSFSHLAMAQLARLSKLLSPRFTDLPLFLAAPGIASNGFAPLMKTAEAIAAKLTHAAQPTPIWPSINADGVEDALTNTPTAARALIEVAECATLLTAIELIVAAQAAELRGAVTTLGPPMASLFAAIRELSPVLDQDRPLTTDVTAIHAAIRSNAFV